MRRTAALCGLALLGLALGLPGYGPELTGFDETVALRADGSAEVRLTLVLPSGQGPEFLVPAPCAASRDIRVQGLAPSSVRIMEVNGDRFLAVDTSGAGPGPLTLVITFQTDGCFKSGPASAFGNRTLSYEFLNVTFERIKTFRAALVLPPGYVFNDVGAFSPKAAAAGGAVPYAFGRSGGNAVVRLSADDVRLGDEVSLSCTFKSDRKPKALLVVLVILAAAYLVAFRGLVKNGGTNAGAKP